MHKYSVERRWLKTILKKRWYSVSLDTQWFTALLETNSTECIIAINKTKNYYSPYVCKQAYGEPLSPYHWALHKCHNKYCINPKHLYWGTTKQNAEDQVKAYRDKK